MEVGDIRFSSLNELKWSFVVSGVYNGAVMGKACIKLQKIGDKVIFGKQIGDEDVMSDANNQMFLIAWAIIRVENNQNWCWSLSFLMDDLNLGDKGGINMISDGHTGLIQAIVVWLPNAEHRKCTRHIYANFKKRWSGLLFKRLFWAAVATSMENPNSWCNATFENEISEIFNLRILGARGKPIITILEDIGVEVDDQAMHILLLGLTADVCAVVDSFHTTHEMWKRIQRLKKGIEIGIQEKGIILLDELEKFTYTEGETIGSYFKRISELINDLDINKLTQKTVHTNLKFPNDLQPEWTHFVTRVKQPMDLNYTNRIRVKDSTYYTERLILVQQEEVGIPLIVEQHDFLSYASDEKRKEWEHTANYLFMTKLQSASPNTNTTPVYDTDGISKVHNFDHCYDNAIYNLFTHMDFDGDDSEQQAVNDEETKAYFESLLYNFNVKFDKRVMVNRNDKVEIERLTTELEQYKA
ncbi:protein NRDE2 [Tanacetum coccineum]